MALSKTRSEAIRQAEAGIRLWIKTAKEDDLERPQGGVKRCEGKAHRGLPLNHSPVGRVDVNKWNALLVSEGDDVARAAPLLRRLTVSYEGLAFTG
jgi:hypothetical protein